MFWEEFICRALCKALTTTVTPFASQLPRSVGRNWNEWEQPGLLCIVPVLSARHHGTGPSGCGCCRLQSGRVLPVRVPLVFDKITRPGHVASIDTRGRKSARHGQS